MHKTGPSGERNSRQAGWQRFKTYKNYISNCTCYNITILGRVTIKVWLRLINVQQKRDNTNNNPFNDLYLGQPRWASIKKKHHSLTP